MCVYIADHVWLVSPDISVQTLGNSQEFGPNLWKAMRRPKTDHFFVRGVRSSISWAASVVVFVIFLFQGEILGNGS